jgi:hypothetical protein
MMVSLLPHGLITGTLLALVEFFGDRIIIDVNLVITWSFNPHAMTLIPRKPSKSGLIGV